MKVLTIQGQRIPALGLGTWDFRGNACREGVEHALDIGYRHLDTAQAYDNEEEVGWGLRNAPVDRDEVFVTTKIAQNNLRPASVEATLEESLRKLQLDCVDLVLIHWPSDTVPLEDTMAAMQNLVDREKTRHIGISNFPPSLVEEAIRLGTIFCNQVEYHPYLAQPKLLAQARQYDYLLTAYCPIARAKVNDDSVIRAIGETHGKSPVQVTLRWLIQQDHVAAIPKAASAAHRQANLEIFDFELSAEEMEQIDNLQRGERICDPEFAPDWER